MPYETLSELGLCRNSELGTHHFFWYQKTDGGAVTYIFKGRIPGTKTTELAHWWCYRLSLEELQENMSTALCVAPSHVSPATSDSHRVTWPEHTRSLFHSCRQGNKHGAHLRFPLDPTSIPSPKQLPPQRPVRSQVSH